SGSPPCTIPYLIILWKVVPVNPPVDAVLMKYAVVSGAAAASRSTTNVPAVVSTTACWGAGAADAAWRMPTSHAKRNAITPAHSPGATHASGRGTRHTREAK